MIHDLYVLDLEPGARSPWTLENTGLILRISHERSPMRQ
jgi:hypothetical protein